MFKVSYIDANGEVSHTVNFASDKDAYKWIKEQDNKIVALKLLVWSEQTQCFRILEQLFYLQSRF